MSLGIKFSMSTIKDIKLYPDRLDDVKGSWGIPWSTWLPSFPDWGMWTGAHTFRLAGYRL